MILSISIILILFSVVLTLVWMWFFKSEIAFCEKLYKLGMNALENKQYKKAKGYLSRLVSVSSDYKDARMNLGLALMGTSNFKDAKGHFEQVLVSSPKEYMALFNLAQAQQFLKLYDEAKVNYNKALEENDKSVYCWFNLGLIEYYQKNYETALSSFQKANGLLPNNDEILFYMTRCKDELCSFDDECNGEEIVKAYLSVSGNKSLPLEFNRYIAKAYAKLGQIDMAEKYCKEAISANPKDAQSYKLLGVIQLLKQDFEATKITLDKALKLNPKSKEIHNLLSYALCHQVKNCSIGKCRMKYHQMVSKILN